MAKVREELDEIMAATDHANLQEEFGDLFFSLADLADGFGIDAEAAAREANLKFAKSLSRVGAVTQTPQTRHAQDDRR